MTRILVIRRGGLGDTLLTAPLLRALRRQHDGAEVHLAGTREFCDVLSAYGIVDAAHSAEDFLLWIPDRARQRLASFDLVIGDEPDCVQHAFDLKSHVSGTPYALQLARQIGCEPAWPADCQLLPPRATAASGAMVVAPGSGGVEKCWPAEHWLALAHRFHAQGYDLQVVIARPRPGARISAPGRGRAIRISWLNKNPCDLRRCSRARVRSLAMTVARPIWRRCWQCRRLPSLSRPMPRCGPQLVRTCRWPAMLVSCRTSTRSRVQRRWRGAGSCFLTRCQ